jgi:type II secretory pathway predicted ATPase ExeA
MINYKNFYGFQKEPFPQIIDVKSIYHFPGIEEMEARFNFAVDSGMVLVITGAIGAGKSTFLRYACSKFHPAKYKIIPVVANSGSMLEMMRQIALGFQIENGSSSITRISKEIKQAMTDFFSKKTTPVLVIDEAHLMREAIFREIHTLLQLEMSSDKIMPLILSGQVILVDKLKYHSANALASRVMGKAHIEGLDLQRMSEYLLHHLKIAGIKDMLYNEASVMAIHQGSGGILRKANMLARGALLAAAFKKSRMVTAEHVRLAATELI